MENSSRKEGVLEFENRSVRQFGKEGRLNEPYSRGAHHLLTEPKSVDFGLYYKVPEFRNLTTNAIIMADRPL